MFLKKKKKTRVGETVADDESRSYIQARVELANRRTFCQAAVYHVYGRIARSSVHIESIKQRHLSGGLDPSFITLSHADSDHELQEHEPFSHKNASEGVNWEAFSLVRCLTYLPHTSLA